MKKKTEIDLQKLIVEYLNLKKCYVWRTNNGVFFKKYKDKTYAFHSGTKGQSDIIGLTNGGRFIAIEVKIGYNKPTPEQKWFLEDIERKGGISFWCSSLNEVKENMKDYI